MSTMLVEIYDALKEAGASEEKARAAASSLTGRPERWDEVNQRFDRIEQRFSLIEQTLNDLTKRVVALEEKLIALAKDVAVIKAEFGLMKWMNGITIGGVLALLVKAFFG
jgi:septal ring factor EnvC (AmiA/AmiB activator)